jgi:hypothetical protein
VPARRQNRPARESRIAVAALLAIAILTALVIVAWRFGAPEPEAVPGLVPQGATNAPAAATGRFNLQVRASDGASWMEVREGSVGGRLLYSGTLERGQRKTFTGRRALQLALAEPGNIVVRVNGNRQELPAGTSFVVTARRIAAASPS